jgi:hypothetical protein
MFLFCSTAIKSLLLNFNILTMGWVNFNRHEIIKHTFSKIEKYL